MGLAQVIVSDRDDLKIWSQAKGRFVSSVGCTIDLGAQDERSHVVVVFNGRLEKAAEVSRAATMNPMLSVVTCTTPDLESHVGMISMTSSERARADVARVFGLVWSKAYSDELYSLVAAKPAHMRQIPMIPCLGPLQRSKMLACLAASGEVKLIDLNAQKAVTASYERFAPALALNQTYPVAVDIPSPPTSGPGAVDLAVREIGEVSQAISSALGGDQALAEILLSVSGAAYFRHEYDVYTKGVALHLFGKPGSGKSLIMEANLSAFGGQSIGPCTDAMRDLCMPSMGRALLGLDDLRGAALTPWPSTLRHSHDNLRMPKRVEGYRDGGAQRASLMTSANELLIDPSSGDQAAMDRVTQVEPQGGGGAGCGLRQAAAVIEQLASGSYTAYAYALPQMEPSVEAIDSRVADLAQGASGPHPCDRGARLLAVLEQAAIKRVELRAGASPALLQDISATAQRLFDQHAAFVSSAGPVDASPEISQSVSVEAANVVARAALSCEWHSRRNGFITRPTSTQEEMEREGVEQTLCTARGACSALHVLGLSPVCPPRHRLGDSRHRALLLTRADMTRLETIVSQVEINSFMCSDPPATL